jgi:hypothetical protein
VEDPAARDARHADEETLTPDRYAEEGGAAVKKAGKKGAGAKGKARK